MLINGYELKIIGFLRRNQNHFQERNEFVTLRSGLYAPMNRKRCQWPWIDSYANRNRWSKLRTLSEIWFDLVIRIHLTRWNEVGRTWKNDAKTEEQSIICVRFYASDVNFCHKKRQPEIIICLAKRIFDAHTNRTLFHTRHRMLRNSIKLFSRLRETSTILKENGSKSDSPWRCPASHLRADTKMHVNNVHHVITFHKT